MNKRENRKRIAIKRILPAAMAAAFLCCSGCAKPEESPGIEASLPDKGYITLTAVVDESTEVRFEPVPSDEIKTPEPEQIPPTHIVNAQDVKLRKGRGTSHDIIAKLDKGTGVTVYSSEDGWHWVKTAAGDVGYISAEYVSTTANGISYGIVSKQGVNLRKGPGTGYDSLGELDKGTELTIYSLNNGWYEVKTTAGEGHISAEFVSETVDDEEEEANEPSESADKPKKTESPKDDEKTESTPKPTEKPKKKVNTPYSKKYTKVKVNYVDSDPIKFETSTMSGDGVSQSMFAKNAITVVNIWTRT